MCAGRSQDPLPLIHPRKEPMNRSLMGFPSLGRGLRRRVWKALQDTKGCSGPLVLLALAFGVSFQCTSNVAANSTLYSSYFYILVSW